MTGAVYRLDDIRMSASELTEMKMALEGLFRRDAGRSCYMQASEFQTALEASGLKFGTPAVDHVLSLCDVNSSGVVDYSRFAEEVERAPLNPVRKSERGMEFESTLVGSDAYRPPVDPSMRQDAKVLALNKHITQLFHEFDHGSVGLDMFRQRIRDMNLHETADLQRLMRQPHGFTLRNLIQALSAPVGFGVVASAAGKERGTTDTSDIFATSTENKREK